jgi:Fe2+ or Zn2+ uptake regulation protein
MLNAKGKGMAAKKKKPTKLNVWHRTMLSILKEGKSDTETIVDKMKERKAYHSRGTIRGYLSALHGLGLVEEVETERVRDKGGRMTIRVWKISKKALEMDGDPEEVPEEPVEEEEAATGLTLERPKKNHGRLMNIWHRALIDILKEQSPLSKTEMVKRVKERGAYQSEQTLRGYVTELKNYGLIEAVEDVRVADDRGNMTIPIWKLVEDEDSSPETATVNEPVEEGTQ